MMKHLRSAAIAGGVLAVVVVAVVVFYHMQGSKTANAQTVTAHVPQFGVNVGDYSNCLNGYAPDNNLGDSTSGYWTPVNGGTENGIGAEGYLNQGIGAGDCIQAGMVSSWNETYDWDFKVGIRVAPYLAATGEVGHASNGSTAGDQCDWAASNGWQYTGWASAGGGTSALSTVDPFDTWGVECVQLQVVTSTLRAGITSIKNPSFAITISHNGDPNGNDGATATSWADDSCYLDWGGVNGDSNPPTPSCPMENIGHGGNFWSASVSLGVGSVGAQESANNIPTSMTASQNVVTGTNGAPLYITMKNTGTWPWGVTYSAKDTGTPTGTCAPGGDEPSSGSAKGATCSVLATLTSENYFLAHVPSSFSIVSETIPITYTNVTKTTTYTPQQNVTVTLPCGSPPPTADSLFLHLINTAFAEGEYGPGGPGGPGGPQLCTYNLTIPESWAISYSGGGYQSSIQPGGTVTFPMSSITAPAVAGTYKEQWQMQTSPTGGAFGAPFILPITVAAAAPISIGTITVTSENAANASTLVNAEWDLTGPVTNTVDGIVCSATGALGKTVQWGNALCSGSKGTYLSVPALASGSTYTIPHTETTTVSNYSFDSVKQVPIAQTNSTNVLALLKTSLGNVFSTAALADEVGVFKNGTTTPVGSWTLTSAPSNNSVAFVILWTPNANMQVSPNTISLTSSILSKAVTVKNTGAPYSTLYWTTATTTTSGGNWLSATPSGSKQNGGSTGATDSATISATSTGLAKGTYHGVAVFYGYDGNSKGALVATSSVAVTLTVTSAPPPPPVSGYDCEANNQCVSTTTNPQYSSLSSCNTACAAPPPPPSYFACGAGVCEATTSASGAASCANACVGGGVGGGGGSTLTATCAPSTITLAPLETSQCVLDLNGVKQNATWKVAAGSTGTIGSSSGVYTPSAVGVETVTGVMPDHKSANATVTVISSPPPPPACNGAADCQPVCDPVLTATPSSIVVPESTSLNYNCNHVTQCLLSGGSVDVTNPTTPLGNAGTITGNATDTPTITTVYTLSCVNGNYTGASVSSTVQVTVNGSNRCEQNPNGAGCPGQ